MGGAVFNHLGTVNITTSSILSNTAAGGRTWDQSGGSAAGGAICNADGATMSITTSEFNDNSATSGGSYTSMYTGGNGVGGAINNVGAVTITNSTFSSNSVKGCGGYEGAVCTVTGGAISNTGNATVVNSTVFGNSAIALTMVAEGGGIYGAPNGTTNARNSIIANNTGSSGADIKGLTSLGHNIS